jgi:hypothetical protein
MALDGLDRMIGSSGLLLVVFQFFMILVFILMGEAWEIIRSSHPRIYQNLKFFLRWELGVISKIQKKSWIQGLGFCLKFDYMGLVMKCKNQTTLQLTKANF